MKEEDVLKFKAQAGMEPCWIIWEAASDGGRPYLIAVDTSEEQAQAHVRAKKEEARVLGRSPPMLRVEESWLDHLYGESMTRSFDEAKKMAKEVQRAQVAELRVALRHAIELARDAIKYSYNDRNDILRGGGRDRSSRRAGDPAIPLLAQRSRRSAAPMHRDLSHHTPGRHARLQGVR